jgi:hypothetical protein
LSINEKVDSTTFGGCITTISLSLAQLLLGIVIITIIVITTFEVTVSTIMET